MDSQDREPNYNIQGLFMCSCNCDLVGKEDNGRFERYVLYLVCLP